LFSFFLSFFLSLSTMNCERIPQHQIELLHSLENSRYCVGRRNSMKHDQTQIVFPKL
jgi:hypothetical protein